MKKTLVCLLLMFLLSGCSRNPDELEQALSLRSSLLQASQCSFTACIIADYGDQIASFSMDCGADSEGNVSFTIVEPDVISGISGKLSEKAGQLIFEDTALHFPLIADEQLSPVSAPWIFLKTLRSGFLTSACRESDKIHLTLDDSYAEDALTLDIWLNSFNQPERADILHNGRRILSVDVRNFEIL